MIADLFIKQRFQLVRKIKMPRFFCLVLLGVLSVAAACSDQIRVSGAELYYQSDIYAYKSTDGKSIISRHAQHDDLTVWIYIRPDNPIIIVTVDPCPSENSRWLQWDDISGKYFTVELDKKP